MARKGRMRGDYSIGSAQWPIGGRGVAAGDYNIGQDIASAIAKAVQPIAHQVATNYMAFSPPLSGPPVVGGFGQGHVVDAQPGELAGGMIGFLSDSLAQGVSATLSEHAQNTFRPERFIVGADTDFTIDDLRVGVESQILNGRGIPASVFAGTSTDTRLKMKTVNQGQDVIINLTRTGAQEGTFRAALVGTQLK